MLSEAERLDLEAYVNQKWYGIATAGYAQPETRTAVLVREDAVLTMNGTSQSVTSLSGSGAVSNGTLVVTETLSPGLAVGDCATMPVTGNLKLAGGATFEVDYPRPSHDLVTVSGTLTVAGGGTLAARLPEPPGLGWASRTAVLTFGSLQGAENLASWTVTGLPTGYTGSLVADGTTVYLAIYAKGSLIMVR